MSKVVVTLLLRTVCPARAIRGVDSDLLLALDGPTLEGTSSRGTPEVGREPVGDNDIIAEAARAPDADPCYTRDELEALVAANEGYRVPLKAWYHARATLGAVGSWKWEIVGAARRDERGDVDVRRAPSVQEQLRQCQVDHPLEMTSFKAPTPDDRWKGEALACVSMGRYLYIIGQGRPSDMPTTAEMPQSGFWMVASVNNGRRIGIHSDCPDHSACQSQRWRVFNGRHHFQERRSTWRFEWDTMLMAVVRKKVHVPRWVWTEVLDVQPSKGTPGTWAARLKIKDEVLATIVSNEPQENFSSGQPAMSFDVFRWPGPHMDLLMCLTYAMSAHEDRPLLSSLQAGVSHPKPRNSSVLGRTMAA